jgi:iron-sulfur cluster repair protein YtfE (RIC family)
MTNQQSSPYALDQWEKVSTGEIVHHIVFHFHQEARMGVARLEQAVAQAAVENGTRLPILLELQELMSAMCRRVTDHLREEERALFPWILSGCPSGSPEVPDIFRTLRDEHHFVSGLVDMAETVIDRIDGDPESQAIHDALQEELRAVASTLSAHVEMENNVLYHRVLEKLQGR